MTLPSKWPQVFRTKRCIFDLNRIIPSMLNKASNFDHKYDISLSPTQYVKFSLQVTFYTARGIWMKSPTIFMEKHSYAAVDSPSSPRSFVTLIFHDLGIHFAFANARPPANAVTCTLNSRRLKIPKLEHKFRGDAVFIRYQAFIRSYTTGARL